MCFPGDFLESLKSTFAKSRGKMTFLGPFSRAQRSTFEILPGWGAFLVKFSIFDPYFSAVFFLDDF